MITAYDNWYAQKQKDECAPNKPYTCEENRAFIKITNNLSAVLCFFKLDGAIFPEGDCCDWLIAERPNNSTSKGALLELKGGHIDDAIKQLAKTATKINAAIPTGLSLCSAIVVSSGGHIPTTKLTYYQKMLTKRHKLTLLRLKGETFASTLFLSKKTGK